MSFVLCICVLFISFMQSVSGAQFLIIIFSLLFGAAAVPVFATVTVLFTSIYASL